MPALCPNCLFFYPYSNISYPPPCPFPLSQPYLQSQTILISNIHCNQCNSILGTQTIASNSNNNGSWKLNDQCFSKPKQRILYHYLQKLKQLSSSVQSMYIRINTIQQSLLRMNIKLQEIGRKGMKFGRRQEDKIKSD